MTDPYLILAVNDQWATALDATTITHLTTSSTETLGLVDLQTKETKFRFYLKYHQITFHKNLDCENKKCP